MLSLAGKVLCTYAKVWQRRTMLEHTNSPICGRIDALMLMVVSTLVRFSEASPRRSSEWRSEEFSSFSPQPLMEG